MVTETYNYENFYQGGYSSLNPDYGNFIGFRLPAEQIAAPTSIQTANQLNEVISRIREGVKAVELQPLQAEVFEQIPKQHMKEIHALTKLTGVKTSVHAPLIDPAGFGEKGYGGDLARENAERKLFSVIERSHELDPEGNIPIVVHSSGGVPGSEYIPEKGKKPGEVGRFKEQKIIAINQENPSQMIALQRETKYYPELEGLKVEHVPSEDIASINNTEWTNNMTSLALNKKEADAVFQRLVKERGVLELAKKEIRSQQDLVELSQRSPGVFSDLRKASLFLQNTHQTMNGLFNKAYKYGDEEQKRKLKTLAEQWQKEKKELLTRTSNPIQHQITDSQLLDKYFNAFQDVTLHKAPKVFVPVEDFAMDKAAQTFGNLAFKSYSKFKDKAPILAVENMFQGFAFARAEDMKKLIEKSKESFVKKAVDSGMGESKARRNADQLIGMTWDVGHLNTIRKLGFTEEDIIKETEKVAKLVKHVHLTDNFGYSDSHLPPGMGNVPIKRIMEELEKAGSLKKARAVIEAGGFVQHFKKSPHPFALQAFGSPIYGAKMAPYWNQAAGMAGNYFAFPLTSMPEKHFSTYGPGFSSLPEELGGQIPGTASRFAGAPTA